MKNPASTTGDFGRTAWDKRFLDYSQESKPTADAPASAAPDLASNWKVVGNVVYAWERWVDSNRRSVSMELIDAIGQLRALLEAHGKYEAPTGDGGRR